MVVHWFQKRLKANPALRRDTVCAADSALLFRMRAPIVEGLKPYLNLLVINGRKILLSQNVAALTFLEFANEWGAEVRVRHMKHGTLMHSRSFSSQLLFAFSSSFLMLGSIQRLSVWVAAGG